MKEGNSVGLLSFFTGIFFTASYIKNVEDYITDTFFIVSFKTSQPYFRIISIIFFCLLFVLFLFEVYGKWSKRHEESWKSILQFGMHMILLILGGIVLAIVGAFMILQLARANQLDAFLLPIIITLMFLAKVIYDINKFFKKRTGKGIFASREIKI